MFKNFEIPLSFEQDINIPSLMSKKRKNSDSASLPKKTIMPPPIYVDSENVHLHLRTNLISIESRIHINYIGDF